ncbi:hypothetical protein WICANDRAFT_34481 [Wickerhamomyces anomalus NRRL Y-366-8]|uniref:Protein rds1 n=1 Tax=Wickerhamomyces anomalus (strain ATCC 58044 / CBS 1984 / NCYC 433 / NRRL Y-366-8) TaxID=683960 RepID=A0A1E3NZA8_WICAA|nr:uncharacterized protein WICANDRAFT_34481 [Wickerhamomyces anomalus NRRL Y-366-8]ODQ58012.1 hypothetical protein WICANDRAFT_34481 [Wickerhamomyces anomalus NRRL Y-366-8]
MSLKSCALLTAFAILNVVTSFPLPGNDSKDPFAPRPFTPAGGLGTDNSTIPYYHPLSDFDYQSLLLALNQEYIELDLFNYGLAKFSAEDFEAAGLNSADRELIHFMALQEVGHAELITNMLGESAPERCNYTYPFETVPEFVAFSQQLTRWGESGVYGFLNHLDSRAAATLLTNSITTEARQQFVFRQFQGLSAMPYDFIVGVPQSFAWTLLAPYITTCPAKNPTINFQNFPGLQVTNGPDALSNSTGSWPAISVVNNTLTEPGRRVEFKWENPGLPVGNVSTDPLYKTFTFVDGPPKYAAWISQLNTTYTELQDVNTDENTAWAIQPNATVFPNSNNTIVNGTVFVVLTDEQVPITPFNITQINGHVVAGPVLYQAD